MDRTILLVDDEENIISSLTRLLRRDGYSILQASSGKQGLELLKNTEVGVIISDQRMPEMTGVEFLSRVKTLYPDTVRMVLSGYTDLKSVTDAINEGAIYKFLTKPWDDELIRKNAKEAFERYEMKRENERLTSELSAANKALEKINQDLERRVEIKTREIMLNLGALQVAQEVMENMPVAVIGIAEDGLIAVANKAAQEWLSVPALVGCFAKQAIPGEIWKACSKLTEGEDMTRSERIMLGSNRPIEVRCVRMGSASNAKGWIVVMTEVHQAG